MVVKGRYKQWNGLLEWNTGLDYWTELFSFFGQVSIHLFLHFLRLLWMNAAMTIDVYCNVFIDISK